MRPQGFINRARITFGFFYMHAPCSASARILSSRLSALWLYFTFFASFLYSVLKVRLSAAVAAAGGLKWTRTIDLTLIRRAL